MGSQATGEPAPPLRRLVHKMTSEAEDEPDGRVAKCVVFLNVVCRPIVGVAAAVRGHYDGSLSAVSLGLAILYFATFACVIYVDERFEWVERWSRILPKCFGAGVAVVQLTGSLPKYACAPSTDWRTCL